MFNIKIDKNDTLFSKMIREADGDKCVFCGRSGEFYSLQASHFWGRGNKTTRFYRPNVDTLCFQCHINNEGNKQGFYRTWKIKQLGKKGYEELERRARNIGKYGVFEKQVVREALNKQYVDKLHLQEGWKGVML